MASSFDQFSNLRFGDHVTRAFSRLPAQSRIRGPHYMFTNASILTLTRRPLSLATGVAMSGALVLTGSSHALAATAGGTQTVTGTTQAGVLSVTAPGNLV